MLTKHHVHIQVRVPLMQSSTLNIHPGGNSDEVIITLAA